MSPPNQPKENNDDDEPKQVVEDTDRDVNVIPVPTTVDMSAQSGDTDDMKETETDGEVLPRDNTPTYVCYSVLINGQQSRKTKIKVNEGDDIDSIIEGIKVKGSPDLDSVPAYRIAAFMSAEQEEPLDALEEWNPSVTWGTKAKPLIVKVIALFPNVAAVSPWKSSNSNRECVCA